MKIFGPVFILTLSSLIYSLTVSAAEHDSIDKLSITENYDYLNSPQYSRNKKRIFYTNAALAGGVVWYGFSNWDWGEESFHTDNEGWLADNTKQGGADKFGHLYTGYAITRLTSSLYKSWGVPHQEAARNALISSLIFSSVMELGDGYSSTYGFSYEDFVSNGIGQLAGYYLETHPELDSKIDIRLEYDFLSNEATFDPSSDYNSMKYLVALKGSGFKALNNSLARYFELHLGYYARGFDQSDKYPSPERHFYAGIGINISEILRQLKYKKSAKVFEYIQLPRTYID